MLKSLGLAALMARCGIPVPAAYPVQMPCFSSVLADIGDEQSLSASLSTFSGHLKRIQASRMHFPSITSRLTGEAKAVRCCMSASTGRAQGANEGNGTEKGNAEIGNVRGW